MVRYLNIRLQDQALSKRRLHEINQHPTLDNNDNNRL